MDDILLVTRPDKADEFRALADREGWAKLRAILPGGAQRHQSVWHGLQAIANPGDGSFVAVHDGARPLVTPDMISRCLALARQAGAACLCIADQRHPQARRRGAPGRRQCRPHRPLGNADPPDLRFPDLFRAYREIIDANLLVTDETSALERIGQPVALLNSGDFNLKITYPQDLELARHLLALRA